MFYSNYNPVLVWGGVYKLQPDLFTLFLYVSKFFEGTWSCRNHFALG